MRITDFTAAHVEQAAQIAKRNYEEERCFVPALPPIDTLPALDGFAADNLGVAAVDNGNLLGFFCWQKPRDNHFGLCKGTWSPVHAHGAVKNSMESEIYDRLYQTAAEKLVAQGVFSHSVTLYEHDSSAREIFFQNGFGGRCVDAIRETLPMNTPVCGGATFCEATVDDAESLAELNNHLIDHLHRAPIFLPYFHVFNKGDIEYGINDGYYQYCVAFTTNRPVAYIRLQKSGENFVADDSTVMNISGAFALPAFRGSGIAAGLLSFVCGLLRERGYTRCGVDFESFNYTARKFWLKHFSPYTISVVRRVDERIANHGEA